LQTDIKHWKKTKANQPTNIEISTNSQKLLQTAVITRESATIGSTILKHPKTIAPKTV
jgi:hypothetical protein